MPLKARIPLQHGQNERSQRRPVAVIASVELAEQPQEYDILVDELWEKGECVSEESKPLTD
jgi:hypothetical protein